MGRGRGKTKKQTIAPREDAGSGEEEKVPTFRRRGRPQKLLKDNIEEDKVEKTEEDGVDATGSITSKDIQNQAATENGSKRKRSNPAKEGVDSVKKENGVASTYDSAKTVGYRQNSSRRKNKPRRAAEAVVECK